MAVPELLHRKGLRVSVTWDIHTPAGASGAVAIIHVLAPSEGDLDDALRRVGFPTLPVGRISRRTILGIDDGLVVRWTPTCAQLMPHGGPVVVRSIAGALEAAGLSRRGDGEDPGADYPEARSEIEARMLAAMARCSSPRAIDLLLDQPRRWGGTPPDQAGVSDPALDRVRRRLLQPPLVVAIGPPNVGKSTLVNALAGRAVSITAAQPGTTRDHVGVELDLAGLMVHYVDTPGLDPAGEADPTQAEAQTLALQAARGADLILACGDARSVDPRSLVSRVDCAASTLAVALRSDLGRPAWAAELSIGGLHRPGEGEADLERLVGVISDTLVPASAVDDPRPWRFWD